MDSPKGKNEYTPPYMDPLQKEVKLSANGFETFHEMGMSLLVADLDDEVGFLGLDGFGWLFLPDGDNMPRRVGGMTRPFRVVAVELETVAVGVDFDTIGDFEHRFEADAEITETALFGFLGRADATNGAEVLSVERSPVVNELQTMLVDADENLTFAGKSLPGVRVLNEFEDKASCE